MEYQNGQPLLGRAPAGAHGPQLEQISRRQVTVPTDLTVIIEDGVRITVFNRGIEAVNNGTGALRIISNGNVLGFFTGIFASTENDARVDIAGPVEGPIVRAIDMTNVAGDATLALRSGWGLSGQALGSSTSNDTLMLTGDKAATLNLTQVGDVAHANAIIGFENFVMDASANWTLSGTQGGEGFDKATLRQGRLILADTAVFKMVNGGTFTVGQEGVLSGNGRISASTVAMNGKIAPGNSIGTLMIDGDLTFGDASIYEVEVDPTGTSSDLIVVDGIARLAGTVVHIGEDGNYRPFSEYTILTATGGFDGTAFDGASSTLTFLDALLGYTDTDVTLRLERNDILFESVATTQNQRGIAGGLESLSFGNPLYDAVVRLDGPGARQAFDQLSGEAHASSASALTGSSGSVRSIISQRFQAAFENRQAASRFPLTSYASYGSVAEQDAVRGNGAWGELFGSWGQTRGNGNAASLRNDERGFLAGVDGMLGESSHIGVFAGYSRSAFSARDRNSSGSSENIHLGIHGSTQLGALRLNLGATHSWHAIDTRRTVAFSGFADSLSASYQGRTAQVFGEAGYRFGTTTFSFEPFAGLAHAHMSTNGFTETGGAAALTATRSTTATTFSTLGLRAFTEFEIGSMPAMMRGTVGWRHAFGDTTPAMRMAFKGGETFSVSGSSITKDMAIFEAGLDLGITENSTLKLSYDGEFSRDTQLHGVNARMQVAF